MSFSTKRILIFYYIKLKRAKGTPHSVALGIAIGLFCGVFIPTFQMILALVLAFIFKANKPMALIFTFVSNPWTIPFLYPAFCILGGKILGMHLTIEHIKEAVGTLIHYHSFSGIGNLGWDLLISFLVGGGIVGIIIGTIGYFVAKHFLKKHHLKKEQIRKKFLTMNRNQFRNDSK